MRRWVLAAVAAASLAWMAGPARADARRLTYGTVVDARFDDGDTDDGRIYADVYVFDGVAGEHVHVSGGSAHASMRIWIFNGNEPLLTLEHDRLVAGDVFLPTSGSYAIVIQAVREGSGRDPIAYALALDRKPAVDDVRFLALESRGFAFHASIHFAFGAGLGGEQTKIFQGVGLVLAPGYQLSRRFGVDLLVNTSVAVWPADDYSDMSAGAAFLVGPRLRLGSKYTGFIGLTPGLAYLLAVVEEDAMEEIDAAGVGLRLDFGLDVRQWRTKSPLVYLQTQRHGELAFYMAGFGVNF